MTTPLSVTIDANGATAPTYPAILAELQSRYRGIFGADTYIDPDSQDGQFLAVIAQSIYDCNSSVITAYNSFNPTYSVGAGLSSVVKINGIKRLVSSNSTAPGNVVGVSGTTITNGSVKDTNGNIWNLPASVTIPGGGSITVTVTAQQPGAISAASGTIATINSPTYGWQSFVSTSDATPGAPVEVDATLRQRQTVSTSLPALTPMGALYGALANLTGVQRLALYENTTDAPDTNGLPAHSICAVALGGTVTDIATTIGQRKTPGAATYGSTSGTYADPTTGIPYTINYDVLSDISIKVAITGDQLAGYSSSSVANIQAAVAAYLNALAIGGDVQFSRLWAPAYLNGSAEGETYEITGMTIAKGVGTPGTSDIVIAFNEAANCVTADITVTLT